jgi:hypothetical protein
MTYAEDGDISGQDVEDIAIGAEWDGDPQMFTDALVSSGFLNADMTLHNWDRYGGKLVISNQNNAERQSRYRDRHDSNGYVTPEIRLPLNKSRVEESREDQPTVETRAKMSRLKKDWEPNDEEIAYAVSKGLRDWQDESENFREYWVSEGKTKADWSLTWKRWVRETMKRRQQRGPHGPVRLMPNANGEYNTAGTI